MKRAFFVLALCLTAAACETYEVDAPSPAPQAQPAQPPSQTLTATANAEAPAADLARAAGEKPSGCCGSGACQQLKAETGTCPCRAAAKAAGLEPSCGGAEH